MADNASTSVLAFHDRRWNSWRWKPILERWGYLRVFINPDTLKTATFLILNGEPDSTVFFVRVALWQPRVPVGYAYYAITTRHSVKDKEVSIRFNLKGGGLHDEPIDAHDWIPNPDPAIDVAVLPVDFPLHDYDIAFINDFEVSKERDYLISRWHTSDKRQMLHRYGTGDEVFSIGLFGGHYGSTTIAQPAVRFGHIALTPAADEGINAEVEEGAYRPIDAFLIEIAALKGQSGSPVFLRPWVSDERTEKRPMGEFNFLIGMIQGFYPAKQDVRVNDQLAEIDVSIGLGIVIPAQHIVEMLMEDNLVKQRAQRLAKIREDAENRKLKPKMASIANDKTSREHSITKESFEGVLKRVSRKIPESQSKDSDKTE